MNAAPRPGAESAGKAGRPGLAAMLVAGVAGVAVAMLTGLALAKGQTTLGTAHNAVVGKTIVVDAHGVTVYELGKTMASDPLCTKANHCFDTWPPLTVPSSKSKLTAAPGITGKLALLHRNGIFQVTLGGRPLYFFGPDQSVKGRAGGQGIPDFGQKWHVVSASSPHKKASPPGKTTSTSTNPYTTPTNPYTTPTTNPYTTPTTNPYTTPTDTGTTPTNPYGY